MKPQRNSKFNAFERKTKENVCFSLETIEFTVALRLHLYFASAALLGGPGWARAGGRAGLGQGGQPSGGAALAAVSELGLFVGWAGRAAGGPAAWAGPGLAASGRGWHAGCAGDCQRAGRWPVGRLPAMARHCLWAGSRAGLVLAASGQGCSALVVAGRCELGWASWLVSSAGQFPRPTTEEPPLPWR